MCAHSYRKVTSVDCPQQSFPPPRTAILVRRLGLGPLTEAPLALLGKAKAQQHLGDLNLFIRDNTLDIPATFDAAKTMI
jgi:hypothetical protein